MTDINKTVSAKGRLAGSRAALLHEMGFNALPLSASVPPTVTTPSVPAPVATMSIQRSDRPSPWVSLGKIAVKNWWAKHPANAALTLAKPTLWRYAQVHPGKILAIGAAAGAVLYVVRPWRLLSVTTIAALVFKRSSIAGMVTRLADHLPAPRKTMSIVAGAPERRPFKRP